MINIQLRKFLFLGLLQILTVQLFAQDSSFIKVHFLYGSKPFKAYKKNEPRWFGGMLGGHAGIEGNQNQVLSFIPSGKFHLVSSKKKPHSKYAIDSIAQFYSRLGHQKPDSAKQAVILIPITKVQKQKFDSLAVAYLNHTPYDYALIGMRCGAATYEMLGQLGILKNLAISKTYKKILYPKILRKKLLAMAETNGWQVIRHVGTTHRKWESD